MAVTKIKPIRGTVNKALAYILDPAKTDDQLYVSSFGCAASDAAAKEFEWTRNLAVQQGMQMPKVIARHLIQSFDIGEVTPEMAHEIGKQFADEWLKGRYEYVIATHIDKGHCHNHIIFNAVNFVDYHAYRSNRRTYREMRQLSDEICKEHGLSVIPPSQSKGMDYKEYTEAKRGTSWKQKLKQTIDRLVITAKDYDDFLRLMQEAGYEIKTGKYISFRAEGQERFTRSKTIGENYTEERIKERIAGRTPRRNRRQTVPKGISLIGDIQERIRLIDSKGYEYKANLYAQAKAIFDNHFINIDAIPAGWRKGNLLDIANYLNGLAMQKFRPQGHEIGLPVLKIKELRQGSCDDSSELCSLSIKPEYIIHNGDVVFSWSGSLLVDIWCGGTCGLNQHLFKVTSDVYDKWFYYLWTAHHLARFIAIAADKATTMGHIKREELAKAEVLIPCEEDYTSFNSIMQPIFELIISNRIESRKLAALRDELLPKLMTGEIDVSDVQL